MKLVVVESPAKAKTIEKILGRNFKVKASMGHVKDLLKSKLSIKLPEEAQNPDEAFEPKYTILKNKKSVLEDIKEYAKKADIIYLATDPDREGEAIAWHIAEELQSLNKEINRAEFIEITEKGISDGINSPRPLNENLYNSQKARRILDRLVGYLISPVLWQKIKRGLSAGRVQTVALRLIAGREKQIRAFVPETYFTFTGEFKKGRNKIIALLTKFNGKPASQVKPELKEEIEKALPEGTPFKISKIEEKIQKAPPPPPFTTSKLQQEASKIFGFTPDKTMRIAQTLYEGVDINIRGKRIQKGLITYMRTDSVRISDEALRNVRKFIKDNFGEGFLPRKPNVFKSSKYAQEAHEAIRPTDLSLTPDEVKEALKADEYRVYNLIFNRFIASQMKPAEFKVTNVFIENERAVFKATEKIKIFPGFTKVYRNNSNVEEAKGKIPKIKEGEEVNLNKLISEEKETQPPPRYSDSTLIKTLEENGVGRPSTYAVIIKTLVQRKYVTRQKRTLFPTELGMVVSDILTDNFSSLFDVNFTAQMEEQLDEIEKGVKDWKEMLEKFYPKLKEEIEKAKRNIKDLKEKGIKTDIKCRKCNSDMAIKSGRLGEYLVCSNEKCGNKEEFVRLRSGEIKLLEEKGPKCEICGGEMVLRIGKYGKFYACSNYDTNCTNTMVITEKGEIKPTISEVLKEKCPQCGSNLVIKKSRKGVRYVACLKKGCGYTRPYSSGKKCPECGGKLIEKGGRARRTFWGCENYPECKYIEKN